MSKKFKNCDELLKKVINLRKVGKTREVIAKELDISVSKARKLIAQGELVSQNVPQLVLDTDDPIFRIQILRKLKRPITMQLLAEKMHCSIEEIEFTISDLKDHGYIIDQKGSQFSLGKSPRHVVSKISIDNHFYTNEMKFGVIADMHMCSVAERLDVLEAAYDEFERQGITTVLCPGNYVDGEARFNKHELNTHGIAGQAQYAIDHWPKRDGIKTYYVDGDDHEGWYCFEPGVEILTKDRGWVDFSELNNDDMVSTKTIDGQFRWQYPTKIIKKHHDGNLIRFNHRSLDFAVTPDHRFEVEFKTSMHSDSIKRIMTAQEIQDEFKPRCIGIPRTTEKWNGDKRDTVCVPEISQKNDSRIWHPRNLSAHELAVFCAWYVTEGSCDQNLVAIAQYEHINDENRDMIIQCIKNLGGRPLISETQIRVSSKDLKTWIADNCGRGWENKKLPEWILNMPKETLLAVFDAMIRGDGHNRGEDSGWKFYSGSQRLLAQMAEICQKIGLTTSSCPGNGCINMHVGEMHKTAFLFEKPFTEKYCGDVYCVSVPNERIYVRKNGKTFWSMNCQNAGLEFGRYLMLEAQAQGRDDLIYMGYMEADIEIKAPKGSAVIKVIHAGGGSSYAFSYASQKLVESFTGGEKPSILIIGHYHKQEYCYPRSVHCVQAGCAQDQTKFMRKKRLAAHLGFCIVKFQQDIKGSVTRFCPEFFPFFDKKYYLNRDGIGKRITSTGEKNENNS